VRTRLSAALVAVLLLAYFAWAVDAEAFRGPTGQEREELIEATDRSPHVNHRYAIVLANIRVASKGGWARASLQSPGNEVQGAWGIYRHDPAPRWVLVAIRNERICIGRTMSRLGMPRSVQVELGFRHCPRE
jgi:hypothetical protein